MSTQKIARAVLGRWSAGWSDALAAAGAAGIAWSLAHELFGHPRPVFAGVAAVISLAPGLPSRAAQAVNMMLGLATGLVVGEVLLAVPVFDSGLRIALITFLAMMAALSFGLAPVIAIQGGVSGLLVIALGPTTAGATRLADALVGTGVALVFSQVVLTPNPVRMIDSAVRRMLQLLAQDFAQSAEALESRDCAKAEAALGHFFASREGLDAVVASITAARSLSRWSVRGRLAAGRVAEVARLYDRRAIRLFASTLLFAEAVATNLRNGHEPPIWLASRVEVIARACSELAKGATDGPELRCLTEGEQATAEWEACIEHLRAIEKTLGVLQHQSIPARPKLSCQNSQGDGRAQNPTSPVKRKSRPAGSCRPTIRQFEPSPRLDRARHGTDADPVRLAAVAPHRFGPPGRVCSLVRRDEHPQPSRGEPA
ncbi:MAG TPA: FUSC family protein [Sphingomicrobium sp.]|nr:FUSC family protein [Sphingomicrobium sp.]